MTVALTGPGPAALTAGILLTSHARRLGQRLDVEVVADPGALLPVLGPAIVHNPVLAGCGVGRELGAGALVIVPGPASAPIAASLSADGTGEWFRIDRSGAGIHAATSEFVALCRDRRPAARDLARRLRRAVAALGCTPEPALLDLLFGAPAPPLVRLALALRAGRAMTEGRGEPVTRFLTPTVPGDLPDPLPGPVTRETIAAARADGQLDAILDRLAIGVRDGVEDWIAGMLGLGGHDALVGALVELLGHLADIPEHGVLPPLDPAMDAVAVGLVASLGAAAGPSDAHHALAETFRFLGGRFVSEAAHAVVVGSGSGDPPQGGLESSEDVRLARWAWFCRCTREAADTADALWRQVVDPVQ